MMSVTFDKRLAELDAYLQMLIAENESIDRKLDNISTSTINNNNDVEREGLLTIKNNLETLLGSIKHSIVLLQIAKVSLRSSTVSADDESPFSVDTTSTPPTRPNRPSKSAQSTPGTKLNYATRFSKEGQSPKSIVIATDSATLETEPSHQQRAEWQQQQQYQSQPQQQQRALRHSSPSSQASASAWSSPNAILSAKSAHNSRSKSIVNATDGGCSGVNAGLGVGSRDSVGLSRPAASATANTTFPSEKLVAENSCRGDGIDGYNNGDIHEEADDDDAFFDAADDQLTSRPQSFSLNEIEPSLSHKTNHIETDVDNNVSNLNILDNKPDSSLVKSREFEVSSNQSLSQQNVMPANSETTHNVNNTVSDGSIDWDALYEDEDEEDLGSIESQGSVIKHLLSQIRIGMDLTKVVLPTFILERRSLLEMYADFFAHPDLFSSIPDHETPEDRMIQLVRWYLSAFHAGRKSSVAKKPYNPILGEIFKCQWKLNNKSNIRTKKGENNTNDNKTSDRESLTFIAEQVSHHPPVSAFYAENKEKSISCCAHIYTKSKYLGLSVGVSNVGTGVISLLNHKESYVCTFPSAYGRSILTVPWVELGGPVNIVCNETGYKANIEFVTKPFYGGKKHRVMGEILRPNNERILTIDGEWNGIMYSKSPPNSNDKQLFVDTTSLPVIKKHVDPVTTQDSFESRNVWKEVTRAIKMQDITTATAAKSFIEQRQRDLLKDRLEKGLKWKTRYFEACDDGWIYARSLSSSSGASEESASPDNNV